jgi:hypothetical protein
VRNAESSGHLRYTCFKVESDDGWNDGCNSLEDPPDDESFQPTTLLLTSAHAGRNGAELEEYEKSEELRNLLWFPETYRRPGEGRKEELWRDELKQDWVFFKNLASSREAWRSVLGYWIFRDLEQDWYNGTYYTFSR